MICIQLRPDGLVVGFAVAEDEGGDILDGAFYRAGWEGGVGDGAGDGAALHVFDGVPFGSCEADAGEAFAGGEDDAAALVIPGVGLVLAHDWELDAVDGLQLLQGEAEFAGDEHIQLDQGPAAGKVRAQRAIPLPLGREIAPEVRVQSRIVAQPLLVPEALVPTLGPEVGIVGGEAVER